MRRRILFAVLGVIITGLALSGLLGVLGVFSDSGLSGEKSSASTPGTANPLPSQIPSIPSLPAAGQTVMPGNIPLEECPACGGNPALGSGLCAVCGGSGKLGSGLQQIPIISPEGGLSPNIPLFSVKGAGNTSLLRSIVTADYNGTYWRRDPQANSYAYKGDSIAVPVKGFEKFTTDQITVTSLEKFGSSGMTLPTSLYPVSVSANGPLTYFPSEQQFVANGQFPGSYTFEASHYTFSESKVNAAAIDPDQKYSQVPANISSRIKELAGKITAGSRSPYQKACNIADYLKSTYEYNLDYRPVPAGREANDWFLFEEKKGVCSNFNSAFVVLARCAGIPSRLVDGYRIDPQAGEQVVYASQAHAWSEIKLKDPGWITLDATGTGPGAVGTLTDITSVEAPILKGKAFVVKGTVTDSAGQPVDGVPVDLFINIKKEKTGGVEIGSGTVNQGVFSISATVPVETNVGKYQLMAHHLGGKKYLDSWSDPPVTVQTGTGIVLEVPFKVKVNERVTLKGTLSEESSRPIAGQQVEILLGDQAVTRLTTDEKGQFLTERSFENSGEYTLTAAFAGTEYYLKSSRQAHFLVLTPTRLRLSIPQTANLDQPLKIAGSLSEEASGLAFTNQEITLLIDGQPIDEKARTIADGTFNQEYSFSEEGLHRIEARFMGVPYYYESRAENIIEVVPAAGIINFKWALTGGIILAVVLLAGGAILFLRRRKPGKPPAVETVTAGDVIDENEEPPETITSTSGQIMLTIEFPGIDPPLPDVWGEGDELEMVCKLQRAEGAPLPQRKIEIHIGKSVNYIATGANGSGKMDCTFQKKGLYTITARYILEDRSETISAKRTIRIVDYREEIVELFRALLEWLRSQNLELPPKATPREIKEILAGSERKIPPVALEKVITGFEEADYSLHTIKRIDYKTMFLAQKVIRDLESPTDAA